MKRLTFAASLLLTACGYTDPGEGTRTLMVVATHQYEAGDNNARVEVEVTKGANDVTDAIVTLTNDDNGEHFSVPHAGGARYRLDLTGYRRRLALRVQAGTDALSAQLEGPGPHIINSPLNNAQVSLSRIDALKVQWSTNDGVVADEIHINLDNRNFNTRLNEDNGSFNIPAASLEVGDTRVDVERSNTVLLKGGIVGSKFTSTYGASNKFVVSN